MEKKELTYEGAMERLEILAREMEGGEVAIDQLAVKLKEAQQLLSFCKDKLTKADNICWPALRLLLTNTFSLFGIIIRCGNDIISFVLS